MRARLALSLVVLSLGGCLAEGSPWGSVTLSMRLELPVGDGATDAEGRLITPRGFALDIDSLVVEPTDLRLALAPPGDSVAGFDPADPPPGYSLCHNGHCHHDDGRLVDYEDIAAEIAAASGGGGVSVVQALVGDDPEAGSPAIDLPPGAARDVMMGDCSGGCELPRGEVRTVSTAIARIRVRGTVFDNTTQSRLPAGGTPFDLTFDFAGSEQGPLTFTRALVLSVSATSPLSRQVNTRLELTSRMFEDLRFDRLDEAEFIDTARHMVAADLISHSSFNVQSVP